MSSASTSWAPDFDAVEGQVGDGDGVRLGGVDAGGHVGVHVADVQAEHLGVLGRSALGGASW